MASGIRVNWGIKDLEKQLANINKYDAATQEKLKTAVRTSTHNIAINIKKTMPVRSGKTIKKVQEIYNGAKNEGIDKIKSPTAHLLEFGAKGAVEVPVKKKALHGGRLAGYAAKVNIPQRKANPVMKKAFETEKPNLIKAVEDAIKS